MSNNIIQKQYQQVMDHIAYLVVHYPEALHKLLEDYGIYFKGKPSSKDYSDAIITQLKSGNKSFEKALENLMMKLSPDDEDQFLGLIKGAVGIGLGLIKKGKQRRRNRRAARRAAAEDQAYARSQSAKAKRDLQLRIQQMREQARRRQEEARRRREEEERRRKEEQKRKEEAIKAAAKKKTQNMIMIGGGAFVLIGIGAVLLLRNNRPPYPHYTPPMPMPPTP